MSEEYVDALVRVLDDVVIALAELTNNASNYSKPLSLAVGRASLTLSTIKQRRESEEEARHE